MKNKWLSFFSGKIQLKITGKGIERLLNECTRRNIPMFNVKKKKDAVFLYIPLSDVHAFRKVIRGFDCKCRFIKRKGFPFLVQKSKRNSGFTFGVAAFFIIMFLLSNMLWKIDITGANPFGVAAFFIIMFLLSNMLWKIDITGANPETEHARNEREW